MVHSERDPEDRLDEQASEPGARPGGCVLRAGLGRAAVEGEAVRVRYPSGNRQVWSAPSGRPVRLMAAGHCLGCSGRFGDC